MEESKLEYTLILGERKELGIGRMHRPVNADRIPNTGETLVVGSKVYVVDRIIEDYRKEFPTVEAPGLVNPVVVAYRR